MLYSMFSWPAGLGMNYFYTGRLIKGTFVFTLGVALFFKFLDQDGK